MNKIKQFYIKIDGQPVEVTGEVYRAYKRPVWAERKRRQIRAVHELSLDLMEGGVRSPHPLLEDTVIDRLSLLDALAVLTNNERALIEALFFEGLTERAYAVRIGISQKNVHKKKRRILATLKNLLTA